MSCVYILRSKKDRKRYIGSTDNIDRRFEEHQRGKVASTKNRRPLAIIYTEEYRTRNEAEKRERFFKSGKGREWLNQHSI